MMFIVMQTGFIEYNGVNYLKIQSLLISSQTKGGRDCCMDEDIYAGTLSLCRRCLQHLSECTYPKTPYGIYPSM